LILEDDANFRQTMTVLAPRVSQALAAVPPEWWGLFLGHFPCQAYFVAPGLLRARSLLAHAYIANRPLLDWLAATRPQSAEVPIWPWVGYSIDSAMSSLPSMYAVTPMMAKQVQVGDHRIDARVGADGRRRSWRDINRWRHLGIYHGATTAEVLAIACSPLHKLTLESNLKRIRMGTSHDARIVRDAGLFDDKFYLKTYPDVAASEFDPLLHYLLYGASELRWPNPNFDPKFYASQAEGLQRGANPLLHYLSKGRQLGHATRGGTAIGPE
jgi:hypothetical protein